MSTDTFDNPFTPSAAFRKKGKHVPIDRAAELFETAFHESGHGLSRLVLGIPISWVVIQSRGGQINAPACNTSAYTGFEALMGMACEEARGHDGARARRDMDAACLDLGPLDGQDDDVPEVLEMAREFVREIRGTLEETAKQLLACKPKNGRIQGRHLQAILDDARPACTGRCGADTPGAQAGRHPSAPRGPTPCPAREPHLPTGILGAGARAWLGESFRRRRRVALYRSGAAKPIRVSAP